MHLEDLKQDGVVLFSSRGFGREVGKVEEWDEKVRKPDTSLYIISVSALQPVQYFTYAISELNKNIYGRISPWQGSKCVATSEITAPALLPICSVYNSARTLMNISDINNANQASKGISTII